MLLLPPSPIPPNRMFSSVFESSWTASYTFSLPIPHPHIPANPTTPPPPVAQHHSENNNEKNETLSVLRTKKNIQNTTKVLLLLLPLLLPFHIQDVLSRHPPLSSLRLTTTTTKQIASEERHQHTHTHTHSPSHHKKEAITQNNSLTALFTLYYTNTSFFTSSARQRDVFKVPSIAPYPLSYVMSSLITHT